MTMKVLITCGPTWVAIDQVRVISNRSTGAMGHLIAHEFHKAGAQVTVIEGPVTHPLKARGIKVIKFLFFDELALALRRALAGKYDMVVHAAAVSDFKPQGMAKTKIRSGKPLSLKLVPTIKLINVIKRLSPGSFLVGFKLEPGLTTANVPRLTKRLFTESDCDLIVANATNNGYRGFIINAAGQMLAKATDKKTMAKRLVRILR